jgi:hypothetical protein
VKKLKKVVEKNTSDVVKEPVESNEVKDFIVADKYKREQ